MNEIGLIAAKLFFVIIGVNAFAPHLSTVAKLLMQ